DSYGWGAGGTGGTAGAAGTTGVTGTATAGAGGSDAGSVISRGSSASAGGWESGRRGGTTGVRMVCSAISAGGACATNFTWQPGHLTVLPSSWSCRRTLHLQLVHWMRIGMRAPHTTDVKQPRALTGNPPGSGRKCPAL